MKNKIGYTYTPVQWAWAMYDWAVSVYNLVITSSIFPVYFVAVAVSAEGSDIIDFLGFPIRNSVLYSYALSGMFLFLLLINPLLGALADTSGHRKTLLQFFSYLGAVACMGLYFFTTETVVWAVFLFILAGIGYGGSFVFYNAYLPEIAKPEEYDRVSALGFSLGYIGSVLLLIFNLTMLLKPEWYGGIDSGLASRVSFLSVGVWWALFSQIPFYFLKDRTAPRILMVSKRKNIIQLTFRKLQQVWMKLNRYAQTKRYLISFFFFNMGVQTVMYVATVFAEKELHLPPSNLIATVLLLQLVAIPGAFLASFLSRKLGNKKALLIQIFVWMLICVGGYQVQGENDFYLLAFAVGIIMGGIQSLSRSTYSKLLPEDESDRASFYSFYDVCYNASVVLGTFSYGFTEHITGSPRNSILCLIVFFSIGFIVLFKVKIPAVQNI